MRAAGDASAIYEPDRHDRPRKQSRDPKNPGIGIPHQHSACAPLTLQTVQSLTRRLSINHTRVRYHHHSFWLPPPFLPSFLPSFFPSFSLSLSFFPSIFESFHFPSLNSPFIGRHFPDFSILSLFLSPVPNSDEKVEVIYDLIVPATSH